MPSRSIFFRTTAPTSTCCAALSFLALSLTGCVPPIECDLMAIGSVNVSIADEAGGDIEDVSVRFSVDGGDFSDCDSVADSWICGWERSGAFTIEVSAPGFETQTASVEVEDGECHVGSQHLDIVLQPLDCTEEVVSSVLLTLTDSEGNLFEPGSGAWAQWGLANVDMPPLACGPSNDGRWECGVEQSGPFEIMAGKIGNYTASTTVDVASDGCHPITEEVQLELSNATTPCTEELVPSIVLTVQDDGGALISEADVTYSPTWADWSPAPCDEVGPGLYQCGAELAGSIDVSVTSIDFDTDADENFLVISDECHVVTQYRTVTLKVLPD